MTTIIGLFDGFAEARRLTHTCVAQGVRGEDITIVVNRDEVSVSEALAASAWGVHIDVGPASRGQPAALIALGVPADAAQLSADSITRGAALVSVAAADHQADRAWELMERYATADQPAQLVPS